MIIDDIVFIAITAVTAIYLLCLFGPAAVEHERERSRMTPEERALDDQKIREEMQIW